MEGHLPTLTRRIDLPPDASARLRLPDDFGTRFILFGDAEEEFDWQAPFDRHATATTAFAALPAANARFASAGLVPCWLADWPVVDNPASAAILRALVEDGSATVGTQLHPWVSPPFSEEVGAHNSFTGNLPRALQAAKLAMLTDRIEATIGVRPVVYRAGRYGIGRDTAELLVAAGYRLDVSVRASFDYRNQGGPDFTRHPLWPYRIAEEFNELPLTTAFTGMLANWPGLFRAEHLRGTMARSGLLARVALTPEGVPVADAITAIDTLLDLGHRLFSLSFHTPSLVPGHTPYVRDARDLATFWRWWDGVFAHFARRGVLPAGLDDVLTAFERAR